LFLKKYRGSGRNAGDTNRSTGKGTHFPDSNMDKGVFVKKQISRENDIEISFVNKITSQFPDNIAKVIFFGSRAKGIPKPDSDYDFLVILRKKDRLTSEGIYEVVTDFLLEYGVDISLKIYSLEEFQKMISIPTPFMASILKTGRELWIPKSSR
jgi:predicted nucleotidyltransferase